MMKLLFVAVSGGALGVPAERMHRGYRHGAGAQRRLLRAAVVQDERPVVPRRPPLAPVTHCPRQRGSGQRRSLGFFSSSSSSSSSL